MHAPSGSGIRHLPVQLTSFVGREREIAAVRQALDGARLLTLTGAGGSGKTRLALEVAAQVAPEYRGGVAWVELAALADAALLPQQVAAALGLREDAGRAPTQVLLDALREQSLLLLLDNCEHLADACAALADALLRGCPGLRILATSRAALGVGGERAWLVPPLSLPAAEAEHTPEQLLGYEAVQLFVARAQDAAPSFALGASNAAAVAQLCRRLDGIPLAIELAAARVRVLTPEQIAQRLDNAFALLTGGGRLALPRHRTLRATMDWSHDLLHPDEQQLLRRLSVFSGDFSLDAAEAVCAGGEIHEAAILDLIAALVDRSLVVMQEAGGAARYALLETVRQYARERLAQAAEAEELLRRHAAYFAARVEEAAPHFTTVERRAWVDALQREIENVRQALAWSRHHDAGMHLRLNADLVWFWFSTRHWVEGRRWAEGALQLEAAAPPARARAGVLFAVAVLAVMQAQVAVARPLLEEAVALAAAAGDRRLEAYASNYLGMALVSQGSPEGRAPAEAALAWFREAGDLYGLRLSLLILGSLAFAKGELAQAAELIEEGVGVARMFGQDRELGVALQSLGVVYLASGEPERAASTFRDSLAALRRDPAPLFVARSLEMLAAAQCDRGSMQPGARLFGAASRIREAIGAAPFQRDRDLYEPRLASARARLGDAEFERLWALGRGLGFEQAIDAALEAGNEVAPPAPAEPDAPAAIARATAPPALRVLALGPLEISLLDRPLDASAWSHSRPRELLLYLLTHPEGRTREQIGLAFWPDSSPAQVKNSFHVALHHLRKLLGNNDWIVFDDERYRINPDLGHAFDAADFETRITALLRGARAGDGSVDRLREALALYRGDFLEQETVRDWYLAKRDRLSQLYVDGLFALGELLVRAERHAEAADVYERIVRKDDLQENAHRCLMQCLARTGDRTRALRHYERLVVLLRDELDAEPEAETVALYEQLQLGVRV